MSLRDTNPTGWVLGIESSCDETGVALYQPAKGALHHTLHSQIALHAAYGGVVPELASRDHVTHWVPLVEQCFAMAGIGFSEINGIAYTEGPGLAGALLIGANAACAMGLALDLPVVGVHHLEGHLLSPMLSESPPAFPFVALLVSGGHTQLMAVRGVGDYQLLGDTLDDAAGEAFDKSAKLLGLPYPGGALLSKLAQTGDPCAFAIPRPLLLELKSLGSLDFSFSGLKTAVALQVKKLGSQPTEQQQADLAASVEAAIVDVLCAKAIAATKQQGLSRLVVAGGVGANTRLRAELSRMAGEAGLSVYYAPLEFCTDNGAMIALAGSYRLAAQGRREYSFSVKPRWPLSTLQTPTNTSAGSPS